MWVQSYYVVHFVLKPCVALRAGHSSYNALQATVLSGLALYKSLEQIMVQMNASE